MNTDNYSTILKRTETIKNCLLDYNYPHYDTFSDDERIKVLSVENFPNLIRWLFERIDVNYRLLLIDASKDKLANLICQYGFCTNRQKFEFIDGKLPHNETVEILFRMFNFLRDSKDLSTNTSDIAANINIEDYLKDLQSGDTNLFPGKKLKFTPEEAELKLQEYRDEINRLGQISNEEIPEIADFPVNDLKNLLEEMKANLNMFKIETADLLWQKVEHDPPLISSKYKNLGEEFQKEWTKLSQLIQDTMKIHSKKPPNSECGFNLALVKEKMAILNNLIQDMRNE